MSAIRSIGHWPTNAHLIADAHALGYFSNSPDDPDDVGTVLDATYGEGNFWTVWRPEHLTTVDLYKRAAVCADFRALPFPDRAFDVVVFDPPYKLNGTPAMGEMDHRYGTERRTTRGDVLGAIADGARECWRLTGRWLLVKVMDQVEGGQMRWQTDLVTERLADVCRCGHGRWEHHDPIDRLRSGACATFTPSARKVDRFDYPNQGIPQPGDRQQRTARRTHSQLLVFRRTGRV